MQAIVGCDTEGLGRARLTWNGDGLGWAAFVHRFVGSCAGWGMEMAALGWARLVCGFVGSWVALGFGCVTEVKEEEGRRRKKARKKTEVRKKKKRKKGEKESKKSRATPRTP